MKAKQQVIRGHYPHLNSPDYLINYTLGNESLPAQQIFPGNRFAGTAADELYWQESRTQISVATNMQGYEGGRYLHPL